MFVQNPLTRHLFKVGRFSLALTKTVRENMVSRPAPVPFRDRAGVGMGNGKLIGARGAFGKRALAVGNAGVVVISNPAVEVFTAEPIPYRA
jgi:hypothetical protein